jgi:hypothetical protein
MYVVDHGREDTSFYTYIPWPVKNTHPLDYFGAKVPWSVMLNGSVYEKCDDDVQVTLTRNSDGRTWRFSAARSDGYFNIDDNVYEDCIIFRPGVSNYQAGESWLVEITGLKKTTGETTSISYTTTFSGDDDSGLELEDDNPKSDDGNSGSGVGCHVGYGMPAVVFVGFVLVLGRRCRRIASSYWK